MKDSPWKTHSSEYTYENPWFKVRTDQVTTPGGKPGIYGVIEIPPAVTVIALNDKQEFCLIHEYRYPHKMWMWELPIGATDADDANPLEAAKRELLEETGYTSESWERVGQVHGIKGLSNHVIHIYLARDIAAGKSHIESDEAIAGKRFVSFSDFFAEVRAGKITDEESIAAVASAAAHMKLL